MFYTHYIRYTVVHITYIYTHIVHTYHSLFQAADAPPNSYMQDPQAKLAIGLDPLTSHHFSSNLSSKVWPMAWNAVACCGSAGCRTSKPSMGHQ